MELDWERTVQTGICLNTCYNKYELHTIIVQHITNIISYYFTKSTICQLTKWTGLRSKQVIDSVSSMWFQVIQGNTKKVIFEQEFPRFLLREIWINWSTHQHVLN